MIDVMAQIIAGFDNLNRGFLEHLQQAAKFLVHGDQINQQVSGAVELAEYVVLFIFSQQQQGLLADGQPLAAAVG